MRKEMPDVLIKNTPDCVITERSYWKGRDTLSSQRYTHFIKRGMHKRPKFREGTFSPRADHITLSFRAKPVRSAEWDD